MIVYYRFIRLLHLLFPTLFSHVILRIKGVRVGKRFRTCGYPMIRNYAGKNGIVIGDDVSFNSYRGANPIGGDSRLILFSMKTGRIIIGHRVGISNAAICSANLVEIGDQTIIGGGAKIYDTDFHSTDAQHRMNGNTGIVTSPVIIGKRVFVGAHSIILKGVVIGDDAVIGAGSVVTKNIPSREIWAGNPAKFIRKV